MRVALPFGELAARFRRRIATANTARVLVVSAAFAALIAAGAYSGRDLTGMLRAAMSRAASFGAGTPATPAAMPRSADPVAQFSQTRVGHLLFTSYNSNMCRRVLFDNRTGAMSNAGHIYCGQQPTAAPESPGQDRAQTLLKSFRR